MAKKSARLCLIEAPCKINLHLEIGKKRPDGYHSLESIFASLALADSLRVERSGRDGDYQLSMNWGGPSGQDPFGQGPFEQVPVEQNLVSRAVSLFREKTDFKNGLKIHLDKHIPAGAGLGGGSSDAASALLALDILAGTALSRRELMEMALLLGSDVPFFLSCGAAFVRGRGEIIEPVEPPQGLWVVLVKPEFSSNTALAFKLLEKDRSGPAGPMPQAEKKTKPRLIRAFLDDPVTWPFSNDFLGIFLKSDKAGVYRSLLETLRKTGASYAGLSGSGSSCFGIFKHREAAERAEKELAGNFVRITIFLAQRANPVVEYQ